MTAPAKARNDFTQDIQECGAVLIVVKDRLLQVPAGGDVVERAGTIDTPIFDPDL